MSSKFIIYGLFDPRDGQLRYVGKTESKLGVRKNHHIYRARSGHRQHVYCWIRQILALGLEPEMVELESLPSAPDLVDAEIFWIAYYRGLGCRLTNLTCGGEGSSGYRHTDEARHQMSVAKKNRVISEETKMNMRTITPDQELRAVELYGTGLSLQDVADAIGGVSGGGIRKVLLRRGIAIRTPWCATSHGRGPKSHISGALLEECKRRYALGEGTVEIGTAIGFSDSAVREQLKKAGVAMRGPWQGRALRCELQGALV